MRRTRRAFTSVIRATIYAHSTDAAAYVPGNPDVFRKVGKDARGLWALRLPALREVPSKSTWIDGIVIGQMLESGEVNEYVGRGKELADEILRRATEIRSQFGLSE
jgi:hypothetical protein